MDAILSAFPDLSTAQVRQYQKLADLMAGWNEKINLVSRKDIQHLHDRHLLHSLGIAKVVDFLPGARVMDLGTGGGLPGLPLAIRYPQTHFHLIDSIGKKIRVVQELIAALGLQNVVATHGRAEEVMETFDFVVTRAVAPMETLVYWSQGKIAKESRHALPNGILALKGGDLREELDQIQGNWRVTELSSVYPQEFFQTKAVVYLPVSGKK